MKPRNYKLTTLKSKLHHSRQEARVQVQTRASSYERGYDARWRAYRLDFLARHPFCVGLGDGCTLVATVVDHIVPHRNDRGLFWDIGNHQPVCDHCHNVHKQRQEHADRYSR